MDKASKKSVLVVDDEEDVLAYLSAALKSAGFDVVTARDGLEALEKVKEKKPDLISLDLVMPRHSGAKFHRELTKNKEWAKIPVLIVTGHARDDLGKADLKSLVMSGPGIYLEKPVNPENYIASVKRLLGMEIGPEESEMADKVELQSKLKTLIDDADPDTLAKIKKMLENK
jgi:two-component system alkaline phosphatase synthesis response regulator PhoP